jgi:hypothetical protein
MDSSKNKENQRGTKFKYLCVNCVSQKQDQVVLGKAVREEQANQKRKYQMKNIKNNFFKKLKI